jgi:L-fucose mutarotase
MLKTPVLHPELLHALGSAGHHSKILISDGNYPHADRIYPGTKIVWANFMPGLLGGNDCLKMVSQLVPIELVEVMEPARSGDYAMAGDPPIWADYRRTLKEFSDYKDDLVPHQKPEFIQRVMDPDLHLVIATAEIQVYANVLVTIGVVSSQIGRK